MEGRKPNARSWAIRDPTAFVLQLDRRMRFESPFETARTDLRFAVRFSQGLTLAVGAGVART